MPLPTSSKSSNEIAIHCEGIGKRYRLGREARYRTLREALVQLARAPLASLWPSRSGAGNGNRDLWALRDVSLEVRHGEVLGIIGRNGSGKSTLLKILSRITKPTEGEAQLRGRVGSLLEVGAGFHSELTGRENIFLNGAILGMTRREIERKFDEIVEFSECGRMLDTAVKHYSSGMYVRLAFAVAAHLETEIMLVDEVLAVGDAAFQRKCLGKVGDAAKHGRTVIFVSHNMLAVEGLCTRAICLHEGRVILEGSPGSVTSRYMRDWLPAFKEVIYDDIETAPGNDLFRLRRVCVRPQNGHATDTLTVRTPLVVEFEYWKLVAHDLLDVLAKVFNEHGVNVFSTARFDGPPSPAGLIRTWFVIPADLMNNGIYSVHLGLRSSEGAAAVAYWEDLATFEIHDVPSVLRGDFYGEWPGVTRPSLEWKIQVLEPLPAHVVKAQGGA